MIQRLQLRKRWRMQEYYRFGKLIHYISDAFTYPHNEIYNKSIKEHRSYERMLNCYFKYYITIPQNIPAESVGKSVMDAINLTHQEYLKAPTGMRTDVRYIMKTTNIVLNSLIPETVAFIRQPLRGAI
jgi:hypothetical protein